MEYNKEANACPEPAGILLIIGGKEDKGEELKAKTEEEKKQNEEDDKHAEKSGRSEVLKNFIQLTGKEDPVIEVITTASSEGDEMFATYKEVFGELKITNIRHIHHALREEVIKDKGLVDRVDDADAFFFTGGDQLLLTSLYGGSDFLTRLKERYINDKIVVAGTSAGAMAMSTPMIYAGNKEKQQIAGEVKITTGLEFLKDLCIDTHFVDRGRFVRMAQVIATNPTSIGIGIEEDTAIIVRKGTEAEVIGTGTIIVIDGFSITSSDVAEFDTEKRISIQNMRVHIYSKGDTYKIPQIDPPHK
ncbi:MAG: cyanophycinase [Parafilimonas sp.]|nr:cyanophycinase [Parafilimonas sp.]